MNEKLRLIRVQDGGRVQLKEHTKGHFAFDVVAPLFILRQWPGRQVKGPFDLTTGFHIPANEGLWGPNDGFEQFNRAAVRNIYRDHMMVSRKTFDQLIAMGVAYELAYNVLPLSTYSQRLVAMRPPDIYEFAKISAREPPQASIRVYAKALLQLAWGVEPATIDGFLKDQWPKGDWPVFDLIEE